VALRVGALEDATDLFAARVGASVTGCFVSPGYAAERGVPKTPADLAQHECVLVGRDRRAWSFASSARRADVAVGGRLVVDSFRVARDAAALGVGVARVPTVFAESLVARGELVPVLERYWTRGDIHTVHAGPVPAAPRVRAFIEAVRAAVSRALPETASAPARPPRWRSA
jgi:DNA-binding transcriptional LysR family regulator